jgi:NTE family protein
VENNMRGMVLSGGGSRGAYEAGVLKFMGEMARLAMSGEPGWEDAAVWDFHNGFEVYGATSVGAINATGMAMFPPDQFAEACNYVVSLWLDRVKKTSDIWRIRQPLGIPALWNPSLGVNTPLVKLLTEVVDIEKIKASGIQLHLPAVDLESGDVRHFGVDDLDRYGIDPILASASFPVAFPPVSIADWWLTDGGVMDIAPLKSVIDAGADEIVVILCRNNKHMAYKPRKEMKNALEVGMRVLDIMTQAVLLGDLQVVELYNHLIDAAPDHPAVRGKRKIKITTIAPKKPLGEQLDFSAELVRGRIDQGYEDALEVFGG